MGVLIFVLFIIAIAMLSGLMLLRRRYKVRGELSHSLGLTLLQIKLPPTVRNDKEKTTIAEVREKIAFMEQVFSQLSGIKEGGLHAFLYGKPFFAFEAVVPHVGQEVLFYCAVPRRFAASVEKMIEGVYPEAQLEPVKDYTIFHTDGAAAGALGRAKSRYLPLRTYQTLDTDPLGSILNAFSKVAHSGEGLALQIVCQRAGTEWNHKLSKIVRHLRDGKSLSRAISDASKSELMKAAKSMQSEGQKKSEQEQKGPVNESLVKTLEAKAQKPLFSVNLRIVASAPTQERAKALTEQLTNPFTQFTNHETNSLSFHEENGRSLQKLIYDFSFRTPDLSSRMILSSEELASILHLPNTVLGVAHLATVKAKGAPAPFNILPRAGLLLGTNEFRGTQTEIRMADEDRARHLYIIGQTGTGKTSFMKNLIIQDIAAGRGVCFIDPHGDAAEEILQHLPANRLADVIYFNPGDVARPMGLNMLEYDPNFPEQKTFIINELLEIFNKLYDMKTAGGPMFEQYFRNATALVMDDPESGNTLLEINRVMVDKKFRDYKLNKTTNPLVKTFWREIAEKAGGEASLQNIVPYISSKFDSFLSNEIMRPIVAQEKSAFRLREVMDGKKILLINLSKGRLGELNSSLIGLIMIGKILMAAFSRVDIAEKDRVPFYLYVDEFQNVTTNTIATILSEARKYRLNLTLAHQFIGQLSEEIKKAVFGNVGSKVAFRIGAEDGEFMEKEFGPTFTASDLVNIDNYNSYVKLLIYGQTAPAFSMKSIYDAQKGSLETAIKAKELSRLTYGRNRGEVEAEMMQKFAALERKPTVPPTSPVSPF